MRTSLDRKVIKAEALDQMQQERHEQVLSHLVVWLTLVYEDWLEYSDNPKTRSSETDEESPLASERWHDSDIHLDLLDKALMGLAALTGGSAPGESQQAATQGSIIEPLRYDRRDLSDKTTRLVYVDALARTLAYVWTAASSSLGSRSHLEATPASTSDEPRPSSTHHIGSAVTGDTDGSVNNADEIKTEMAQLSRRIASLEATVPRPDRRQSPPASSLPDTATQLERLAGLNGWTLAVFAATSYLLVSRVIALASRVIEPLHDHLEGFVS